MANVEYSDELKDQPHRVVKAGEPDNNVPRTAGGIIFPCLFVLALAWGVGSVNAID
jgi:hypothetical protein